MEVLIRDVSRLGSRRCADEHRPVDGRQQIDELRGDPITSVPGIRTFERGRSNDTQGQGGLTAPDQPFSRRSAHQRSRSAIVFSNPNPLGS